MQGLQQDRRVHVRDDRHGDVRFEFPEDRRHLWKSLHAPIFIERLIDAGIEIRLNRESTEQVLEHEPMDLAEGDEWIRRELSAKGLSPCIPDGWLGGLSVVRQETSEDLRELVRAAL